MRIIALVTPIANILIGQSCQPIKDKDFVTLKISTLKLISLLFLSHQHLVVLQSLVPQQYLVP